MRISIFLLPLASLVLLPYLILYFSGSLSLFSFLFVTLIIVVLFLFKVFLGLKSKRGKPQPLRLETISLSHFVEKVRWSMDFLGVEYVEQQDVAIMGILFFARSVPVLVNRSSSTTIGNSSDILRYLWGLHSNNEKAKFLTPTPEALELEQMFDKMGKYDRLKAIQSYVYYQLIPDPKKKELLLKYWGVNNKIIPGYQRFLLRLLFPLFAKFMVVGFPLTRENARKGKDIIFETFEFVSTRLKEKKTKYLMGDEISFVDFTFCSLAAVMLCPEAYSGKAVPKDCLPNESDFLDVPELKESLDKLKSTDAGKYVYRVYQEHRLS